MASFCTIRQFYQRYDQGLINQLSNDAHSDLNLNDYIQAALDDGTDTIRGAAIQGNAYTSVELDALVATGSTILIRMCADVAIRNIYGRRGEGISEGLAESTQGTLDLIEALRKGDNILAVEGRESARKPALVTLTAVETGNLDVMTNTDFFNGPTATRTTDG